MALLNQLGHEPEQQREQQGRNVLAIHVSVGHEHDLAIAEFLNVELVVNAGAQGSDNGLDLVVFQHLVQAGFFHIEDLAPQRQNRLIHGVPTTFGRTAGGVALHNVELGFGWVLGPAVRKLAGESAQVGGGFPPHHFPSFAGRHPGVRRGYRLVDNHLGFGRVCVQPVGNVLVDGFLHKAPHLGVAQLRLGLPFELGFTHPHRDHGGQAFTAVVTGEVLFFLFEQLVLAGVLIHQ